MDGFTRVVDIAVIVGMAYLTFAMALAGWFAGLRRGEAVTLLPEQSSRRRNLWVQPGLVAVSLSVLAVLIYGAVGPCSRKGVAGACDAPALVRPCAFRASNHPGALCPADARPDVGHKYEPGG